MGVEQDHEQNIANWLEDRMRHTIFSSYNLLFPRTRSNPLTYLGFLTFATFGLLCVSGIGLMFYYSPDFANSYDSVSQITNSIPFGFELRNIHYYAADFMIVLALAHFFYLLFAGRYRFHNEVIWFTGILFGVLTTLDAYTGYVLIMNERAMLAANIGGGLLNSISPTLQLLFFGNSYSDLILRVYTIHIAILPGIMILLVLVHFPRALQVDLPMIAWISGAIAVVGGIWPVALGTQFVPSSATPISFPEWYLTGIYAFLRTGLLVFVAGVFLPFLFLFIFLLIPFYDTSAKRSYMHRLVASFGVGVISDTVLITIWGFRAGNLLLPLTNSEQLPINPLIFWTAFFLTGALSMLATWFLFTRRPVRAFSSVSRVHKLGLNDSVLALAGITISQAILLAGAYIVRASSPAFAFTQVGAVVMLYGAALKIYLSKRESETHSIVESDKSETGGS